MVRFPKARRWISAAWFPALILAVGACGNSATPASSVPAPENFAGAGPYKVGVTTLGMEPGGLYDREVEVWYPVDDASVAGVELASYRSFEVLPQAIVDILPADLNLEVGMDAYRDVVVSEQGPFPVLTFSHGAGGFRYAYSGFLKRVASWGIIVVSIDHLEWGLLAQVNLRDSDAEDREASDVVLATLSELAVASSSPSSPLYGGVDGGRVATAGHSAGGRAAFGIPEREEVRAMIGFATGGARGIETDKPILLLVGAEDGGAGRMEEAYETLGPVRRFVSIDGAGHNSFTDQCDIIWGGNNFLESLVASGFPIPENLLALAIDGCEPQNLDPEVFWDVSVHFTVAHLRQAFGIDAEPIGLEDEIASQFDGVSMTYAHDP